MITYSRFLPVIIIISMIFTVGCNKTEAPILENIYTINAHANNNYNTRRDSSNYYWQLIKLYENRSLNNEQQFIVKRIEARSYQASMAFDSASICYEQAAHLSSKKPIEQVVLLVSACKTALFAKQTERYKKLFIEATDIAQSTGDSSLIGRVEGLDGEFALRKKKYDKAIHHLELALLNDKANKGLYIYKLGIAHLHKEEDALALEYLLKSETIFKEQNKLYLIVTVGNRIAKLYRKIGRLETALKKQKEVLKTSQLLGFNFDTYNALNEMSIIYSELKQWEKADEYFQKALKQAYLMNRPKSIAITLNNIGRFYLYRGNLALAEEYYTKAYKYRLKNNIGGRGLLNSVWNLGALYESQKKYAKAEELLIRAANISDSINDLSMSSISHKKLAELYQNIDKTEKWGEHLTLYMLKDKELIAKNATKHLQETLIKYETNEKQLLIVQQKQELIAKNKINILLGCIALFFIALITLLVTLYIVKMKNFRVLYKQQNKIEIQKQTINKLLSAKTEKAERSSTQKLLIELLALLEEKKIYKDPKISLNSLSKALATNTSYLSALINSEFKCNFKTLINRYRIDYCKTEICNNINKDTLIKQVAMGAGFSSLSTFHTIFKKETGITPSCYQEFKRKQSE